MFVPLISNVAWSSGATIIICTNSYLTEVMVKFDGSDKLIVDEMVTLVIAPAILQESGVHTAVEKHFLVDKNWKPMIWSKSMFHN